MEGDILVLSFTGVKNGFFVHVKNHCLMSFLVASLRHPFFSVTFMLIWYLKVIGNTLARLVNGMSWIVLKFFKQKAAGCIELKDLFTFLLGFI